MKSLPSMNRSPVRRDRTTRRNASLFAAVLLVLAAASAAPGSAATVAPVPGSAAASPAPTALPAPSPPAATPAPSATPRREGISESTDLRLQYVGQAAAGPGLAPPEAPGFIAGAPLAPDTPYDFFSSAPLVNGNAGVGSAITTLTDATRAFDLSLTAGFELVDGSVTNAAYWTDSLMPTLNPHLGSQALPYRVAFPTHAGGDDARTSRLSLLGASAATADGALRLRVGWFNLDQTDRFVFVQPVITNVNPAISYAPAESLATGVAQLPVWEPDVTVLPLHGADVEAKRGDASLELTSAALPSLPGEDARLSMASLVLDRGEGTRFSAQVLHAATSGNAFGTTIPFGIDPAYVPTPQGDLPVSVLSGQRQTIAGIVAAVHVLPALGLDGIVDVGRAWYDAAPVAQSGTAKPGGFYHFGFSEHRGRVTASVDGYRMEPRYATMILPYGVPENQWSVSFAWPGQWLKSNYQLIDNSILGVNRQGYRLRYFVDGGPLEVHAEFTSLRQIEAETYASAQQTGFIDGFYLPQPVADATYGRQKRTALWVGWHPSFGDITLDLVDDTLNRPFAASRPQDAVSYEVPQAVVSYARHVSPAMTASAGVGRYAIKGAFAEPLDIAQRLYFAGVQIAQTPRATLLVTVRRTLTGGMATDPLVRSSPDFTNSAIVVEQRLRL